MSYSHRETEIPESGWYGSRAQASGRTPARTNGQSLSLRSVEAAHRWARRLGWFSLGLGFAQLFAPRPMSRFIGLGDSLRKRRALQAIGLREVATGVGLLGRARPTGWLWTRVAGDVMDLILLGRAMNGRRSLRRSERRAAATRVPLALASVAGVAALDLMASQRLTRADRQGIPVARDREVEVTQAITVARSPEEVYRFWRNVQNLPKFMSFVESVRPVDERRSRWTLEATGGKAVEWESEITDDRPNERIGWRALPGSPLRSEGEVRFRRAPGGRGTEVLLTMKFEPPGGRLAAAAARLVRKAPAIKMHNDLRRFKQLMEVGEVVRSDASIFRGPHPARPSAEGSNGSKRDRD
jgi:uncharacterized membrane protein